LQDWQCDDAGLPVAAEAADITVLCSSGFKAVMEELAPQFDARPNIKSSSATVGRKTQAGSRPGWRSILRSRRRVDDVG
jgi:ABC-type molybdate transport system substrate-binding protein